MGLRTGRIISVKAHWNSLTICYILIFFDDKEKQRVTYRKDLIITIDGPSGAGKSTIAKMLSQKLGYTFIDTGAMYRGVAYAYQKRKNNETMEELLKNISIRFEFSGETKVFLDSIDVSKEIRAPEISLLASSSSQQKIVREHLYKVQREIGKDGGVVLEGRDTGSVVFPNAHLKFYLDAHSEERAKRRHLELSAKGNAEALAKVKEEMIQRDKNDSERDIAPLVMPEGAIHIDTTGINAAGVLSILLKHITTKGVK
ncbi:MAG: (d)CMP kinase [Syntrophus sp. (in: bacteria)]|nr:(d)CMP kinase [Syntrophus sp. (in: bacteria)]